MTSIRRRSLFAAAAFMLFAATSFTGATEHASAFVPRLLVTIFCLAAWPRAALVPRWQLTAPALALFVVATALLWAPNGGLAAQSFVSVVMVCALYMTLLVAERDHTATLLDLVMLVAAGHALFAVIEALLFAGRARAGFYNPNDLAALLVPTCVWALSKARRDRRWLVLVALLALGVLASASRSGLLALGAALMLFGLGRRALLTTAAVSVVAALALSPLIRERFAGNTDPYAYARVQIWRSSLEVARAALPSGVGLGFASEALRQHGVRIDGPVRYPRVANDAHCEPLNALVELGVLGLAAELLAVLTILAALWRRKVRPHLAMLAAFAIPALVSASLHVPIVALLAAVWAAQLLREERGGVTVSMGKSSRLAAFALLLASLIAALPGVAMHGLTAYAEARKEEHELARARWALQTAKKLAPASQATAMRAVRLERRAGAPLHELLESLEASSRRFYYSPSAPLMTAQVLAAVATTRAAWRLVAEFLAEAARRDPKNALAALELAKAYAQAGEPMLELLALGRALVLEPSCARALERLASHTPDARAAERLRERARAAHALSRREVGRAREILSLDLP